MSTVWSTLIDDDWLARVEEPVQDPGALIVDPHHQHLWAKSFPHKVQQQLSDMSVPHFRSGGSDQSSGTDRRTAGSAFVAGTEHFSGIHAKNLRDSLGAVTRGWQIRNGGSSRL